MHLWERVGKQSKTFWILLLHILHWDWGFGFLFVFCLYFSSASVYLHIWILLLHSVGWYGGQQFSKVQAMIQVKIWLSNNQFINIKNDKIDKFVFEQFRKKHESLSIKHLFMWRPTRLQYNLESCALWCICLRELKSNCNLTNFLNSSAIHTEETSTIQQIT